MNFMFLRHHILAVPTIELAARTCTFWHQHLKQNHRHAGQIYASVDRKFDFSCCPCFTVSLLRKKTGLDSAFVRRQSMPGSQPREDRASAKLNSQMRTGDVGVG